MHRAWPFVVLMAGCSLTTNLDGFAEPLPPDGGSPGVAPSDASFVDSPTSIPDGGGGDSGEGGPPIDFCQSLGGAYLFCDDFSRARLMGEWNNRSTSNATLSILPTFSLAYDSAVNVTGTGYLEKTFTSTPTKIVQTYKVRVASLPPTNDGTRFTVLNELNIGPITTANRVFITLNEIAGTARIEYGDYNTGSAQYDFYEASIAPMPLGSFETFTITVNMNDKSVVATTSFTMNPIDVPLSQAAKDRLVPAAFRARCGPTYANASPQAWHIELDDYVLTTP